MPASIDWLVCFAVPEEAAFFKGHAARRPDIRIVVTGMGRKNAVAALNKALEQFKPKSVLTCGFAGGLDPKLPPCSLAFQTGPAFAFTDRLSEAGAVEARFACVDRVATTAQEKARLRQQTGADVVEMESGPILELCRANYIPAATLRVISDTAQEDLPIDFNGLMTPDMKLDFPKLLLSLAKSPGKIRGLMALQRRTREAAAKLGSALESVTR